VIPDEEYAEAALRDGGKLEIPERIEDVEAFVRLPLRPIDEGLRRT